VGRHSWRGLGNGRLRSGIAIAAPLFSLFLFLDKKFRTGVPFGIDSNTTYSLLCFFFFLSPRTYARIRHTLLFIPFFFLPMMLCISYLTLSTHIYAKNHDPFFFFIIDQISGLCVRSAFIMMAYCNVRLQNTRRCRHACPQPRCRDATHFFATISMRK
jgi:hypothetical protein